MNERGQVGFAATALFIQHLHSQQQATSRMVLTLADNQREPSTEILHYSEDYIYTGSVII